MHEIPVNVTISLMLWNLCNFRCEHCMYSSGPDIESKERMREDVLLQALEMRNTLYDNRCNVEWNLIGGEPTLDMEFFEQVLNFIASHNDEDGIAMTTNGWWLASEERTRQFFNAVTRYVDPNGMASVGGMSVRISDDKWHAAFRPDWLKDHEKFVGQLESVWEYAPDFQIQYRTTYYCDSCDWTGDGRPDGCPECGGDDIYEDEVEEVGNIPEPHEANPWIHIDPPWTNEDYITPTGRGYNVGRRNECSSVTGLTVRPDGQIWDYCCRGSQLKGGTVWDDPLELLEKAVQFLNACGPECSSCHELWEEWASS